MTRMACSIVGVARPQAALVASRAPRRTNTNNSVCCFKANLSRICAHSRFQHASYLLCAQILSIRKYKTTTNTCGIWVCICVAAVRRGWWVFDESKGQGMGVCEPNSIELLTMRPKQCGCGAMMRRTCHWVYRAAHRQLQHHVSDVWQNSVWNFNAILLPVLLFLPLLFHLFSKYCCLQNAAMIVKGLLLTAFYTTFCNRLELIS